MPCLRGPGDLSEILRVPFNEGEILGAVAAPDEPSPLDMACGHHQPLTVRDGGRYQSVMNGAGVTEWHGHGEALFGDSGAQGCGKAARGGDLREEDSRVGVGRHGSILSSTGGVNLTTGARGPEPPGRQAGLGS